MIVTSVAAWPLVDMSRHRGPLTVGRLDMSRTREWTPRLVVFSARQKQYGGLICGHVMQVPLTTGLTLSRQTLRACALHVLEGQGWWKIFEGGE